MLYESCHCLQIHMYCYLGFTIFLKEHVLNIPTLQVSPFDEMLAHYKLTTAFVLLRLQCEIMLFPQRHAKPFGWDIIS